MKRPPAKPPARLPPPKCLLHGRASGECAGCAYERGRDDGFFVFGVLVAIVAIASLVLSGARLVHGAPAAPAPPPTLERPTPTPSTSRARVAREAAKFLPTKEGARNSIAAPRTPRWVDFRRSEPKNHRKTVLLRKPEPGSAEFGAWA